jgi:PPOX class probable F420-dependent enzyme
MRAHPPPAIDDADPLNPDERAFLQSCRVAHLGTADRSGAPHVVPVCFALSGSSAFVCIDEKPKRGDATQLKRLRNIRENPQAVLTADRWDEDWNRLGWVMLRGRAEVTVEGTAPIQELLRVRYPQLRAMRLEGLPVIALRIERVASWGNLSVA